MSSDTSETAMMTTAFAWILYAADMGKSIAALNDVEGKVEGVQVPVINTGAVSPMIEMLRNVTYSENRLLQLASGGTVFHPVACPQGKRE